MDPLNNNRLMSAARRNSRLLAMAPSSPVAVISDWCPMVFSP
jgi:hypothetical protein